METEYFAAASGTEIGAKLMERVKAHFAHTNSSGRFAKISKSYALSTGSTVNNTGAAAWQLTAGGEQGELIQSVENHYRNLGMGILNLTTAERPTIQCSAVNTDQKSIGSALLADGLLDYYLTRRGVEALLKRACKRAVFQSEGFIYVPWDANAGEEHLPVLDEATGEATGDAGTKTGDVAFFCLGPLDVVRDEAAPSFEELNWMMVRVWRSKFELAAQYPELTNEILNQEIKSDSKRISFGPQSSETDLVECWDFYHKKMSALPAGRMVTLLSANVVLFDGPIPYSDIPVYRVVPDDLDGTPFGDTPMFDLMGPQDAVNGIDTACITNQLGRGIGNILVPAKANVIVDQLAGSMNAIKYEGEKAPEPLEWPAVPADLFESKAAKIAAMETLSGISSVTRGQPSENVGQDASGAKLALLDAKSIQNNSGLEKSFTGLVRDVCLAILHRFQDFGGDVKRIAELSGKDNQYLVKEFFAGDLDGVDYVKVEMGNPVLRTTAGKMAVADKAVELGVIKPGQLDKYMMLMRTGQEGPLYEVETKIQMRIRGENEQLMDGSGQHNALISDPHWREIPEHLSMLDNPSIREQTPENEEAKIRITQAVQQHIDLFLAMPPWMVLMRGGPEALAIFQQVQMSMAPPPMPGQPSGTPPPAPGASTPTPPPASGAENVTNPAASKPQEPGLPSMPNQPTGEPAQNLGATIQ